MISYILLIVSIIGVMFSYLILIINKVMVSKKHVDNYTGFDIAKEVTTNYDVINIVSSSDIVSSEYDIKRNIIRLNSKNYDGNSYIDIAVSALLAGISLVNNESSSYFKFSSIFKKIRSISLVPLVMVILSYFISNIGDAKIGIILFSLLLVYQYMRYQIVVSANEFIENNLDKNIYDMIKNIIYGYINFYKVSFIVSLVMLLRLVVIILAI